MIQIIKTQLLFYFFIIVFAVLAIFAINKYLSDSDLLTSIQNQNKDVLQDVKVSEYQTDSRYLFVHLIGKKIRSDCGAPVKITGYYGEPLVSFDFVDTRKTPLDTQTNPIVDHPAIEGEDQDFGWVVMYPNPKGKFYLYLDYLCGQSPELNSVPYTKKEVIGPFDVEKNLEN